MNRYGLFIGINDYRDRDNIQPLRYAARDANRLQTFFARCGFQTELLANADATSNAITARLKDISDKLQSDDLFLLYFSGHGYQAGFPGQPRQFLLTHDTDLWALQHGSAGAVPLGFLQECTRIPGVSRVVILDACRGPISPHKGTSDTGIHYSRKDVLAAVKESPRESPLAMMFSCHPDRLAYEHSQLGGGLFTAAMLSVLEQFHDRNEAIYFPNTIQTQIVEEIRNLALKCKLSVEHIQKPWVEGSAGGIVLIPESKPEGGKKPHKKKAFVEEKIKRPDSRRARQEIRRWVRDCDAEWTNEQWKDFVLHLYESEAASGFARQTLAELRDEERRLWLDKKRSKLEEEKKRKEEEKRRAEELRRIQVEKLWLEIRESPFVAVAPFDSAKAKDYQRLTAEALGVPAKQSSDLGSGVKMYFVLIPPGEFMMGSDQELTYSRNVPQHHVIIPKCFYMGVTPVTQAQYQTIMGKNPSYFKGDDLPVQQISWNKAMEFCQMLSKKKEGKAYRLPTEAEWEYACRAGTTTRFYFGDNIDDLDDFIWYEKNSNGKPHSVAQKKPNAFGLYDMLGNVREWCVDWLSMNYYSESTEIDPRGPMNCDTRWVGRGYHVLRGGSWCDYWSVCESAAREGSAYRYGNHGLRVVMQIEA